MVASDSYQREIRFNPLLRGAASATQGGRNGTHQPHVSIPYFAGRPLQLGRRGGPRRGGVEFQSPTSRGGLCNCQSIEVQMACYGRFNPLLRGAASATCSTSTRRRNAPCV